MDRMRNIKLTIEYDGARYAGWQRQNNGLSVQQVIEEALQRVVQTRVRITGAGRTDAGVHALGQVANFKTSSPLPAAVFRNALNHYLPEDVVVVKAEEADEHFHARFSAKSKTYRYIVVRRDCRPAVGRQYAYFIPYEVCVPKMRRGAARIVGRRDFSSFCVGAGQQKEKNREREVSAVDIRARAGRIEFTVRGTGFLYKMVRTIVGTLLDLGRGRIKSPDEIDAILGTRNRARAGLTVPAHGLYLVEVGY